MTNYPLFDMPYHMVAGLSGKRMDSPDVFTGPVNLGNPVEYSILDLARMIIEMTGSRSEIVFKALPMDDPLLRCPNIGLAAANLNWKPVVAIEAGLKRTIEYFKSTALE